MPLIIFLIIFLTLNPLVGAFCWPYTINEWLEFFSKEPTLVWWQGALLSLVPGLGQLALPAAAVTFILMLFL